MVWYGRRERVAETTKMRGEDANGVGREDSEECGISETDGWMVVLVSEMMRVNA